MEVFFITKYDLVGKRFGKLIVEENLGSFKMSSGKSVIKWKCLCDCVNYHTVSTEN